MPDWTDELKASVVTKYEAAEPTPENTTEIVKDIAEALKQQGFSVWWDRRIGSSDRPSGSRSRRSSRRRCRPSRC